MVAWLSSTSSLSFKQMIFRVNRAIAVASAWVLGVACTHDMHLVPSSPRAAATTTAGPWASMIFAARTDSGVLMIDLGWGNAAKGVRSVLGQIGAAPSDVRWAFITHAHRDHIAGWTAVPQATFVLGRDEVPLFTGTASYRGFAPRLADNLNEYRRPTSAEVTVLALGGDTLFALGRDTLRSYAVPGHTPGSTAYVFRETLFIGDAANWGVVQGFRGALTMYADSVDQNRASLRSLLARLDSTGVRWRTLCTAHGKCGVADSALRARIVR